MKNYLKYGLVALLALVFASVSAVAVVPNPFGFADERVDVAHDPLNMIEITGGWKIECIAVYRNSQGVIIGNKYSITSPCGRTTLKRDVGSIEGYKRGTECWIKGQQLSGQWYDYRVP